MHLCVAAAWASKCMANAGGTNQAPARQLDQSEAVRAAAAAVKDAASSEPPRPIVRNRRIERVDPPAWDAAALPFDYLVSMVERQHARNHAEWCHAGH